jgi:hypothetical protein
MRYPINQNNAINNQEFAINIQMYTPKIFRMTPELPNLTGQEDVYSVHTTGHAIVAELQQVHLVVTLERFPGALARVFALLCLFELIPRSTRTELCAEEVIRVELHFSQLQPDRLDLLVRKLNQLTECLAVQTGIEDLPYTGATMATV